MSQPTVQTNVTLKDDQRLNTGVSMTAAVDTKAIQVTVALPKFRDHHIRIACDSSDSESESDSEEPSKEVIAALATLRTIKKLGLKPISLAEASARYVPRACIDGGGSSSQ